MKNKTLITIPMAPIFVWRAPKSRGETHLRVSQSQVGEN